MSLKPLYLVDMTIYEFLYILDLIDGIIKKYPLKERRFQLKNAIFSMFGKVKIDKNKGPRCLTSSKKKMASNFMITINQLGFLNQINVFKMLYGYLKTNPERFFEELKKILLEKGNWMIYIKVFHKINKINTFRTKTEYLNLVASELYRRYPDKTENGHKRQLISVMRWMTSDQLKILGDFSKNGIEVLFN